MHLEGPPPAVSSGRTVVRDTSGREKWGAGRAPDGPRTGPGPAPDRAPDAPDRELIVPDGAPDVRTGRTEVSRTGPGRCWTEPRTEKFSPDAGRRPTGGPGRDAGRGKCPGRPRTRDSTDLSFIQRTTLDGPRTQDFSPDAAGRPIPDGPGRDAGRTRRTFRTIRPVGAPPGPSSRKQGLPLRDVVASPAGSTHAFTILRVLCLHTYSEIGALGAEKKGLDLLLDLRPTAPSSDAPKPTTAGVDHMLIA